MIDVLDYISSKNIPFKREGQELILSCPNCGKPKLYVNISTGLYHCFVCEAEQPGSDYARGHIARLQELLGDSISITPAFYTPSNDKNQKETNFSIITNEYHLALINNKAGLKYLFKRGITQESIVRFKLGIAHMKEHDWISIPSFENGIPKLIKYRQLPPETGDYPKYIREDGGKSILFNGDVLDKPEEMIIVCEGELDAITLIQNGYENVVGITGGAGTFLPLWYDKLVMKSKIYLCLDSDEAGQRAARDVWSARLGVGKCWNVILPSKDVNQFFLEHKKEDFDKLLKSADQFKVEGLMSFSDALYDLYLKSKDKDNFEKFPLPWNNVNKILGGGLFRKHLTIIGGIPGCGKTSMALQILWHFAKNYKIPGLFFCLEMPESQLAIKIVQLNQNWSFDKIKPDEALVYSQEIGDLPIYFGYSSKIKPDVFYNTMKAARDRYGIEFGVFDNLQRMIRTGEEADMGKASGMFKDLVMDLNIPFILISQPRKMGQDEEITYEMLKGSSAIPADADEVILLNRKRQGSSKLSDEQKDKEKKDEGTWSDRLSPLTDVILDKTRYAPGGIAKLTFLGDMSKFIEDR